MRFGPSINWTGGVTNSTGGNISIAAGKGFELAEGSGSGFARRRFTTNTPQAIRANENVF